MNDAGKSGGQEESPAQAMAPATLIDALRRQGAERFDPVRFCFIEAMARRAAAQSVDVKRMLEGKLAKLLVDYSERLEQARDQAEDALARNVKKFPEAADDLLQRSASGDFDDVQRLVASLEVKGQSRPLAELLAHIRQHSPEAPVDAPANGVRALVESPGELKALTYFRSTWSRLNVDQQLAQALAQVPENAGPLNSQRLALQALKQMRDISPDYLKRFMSYVDALFWLDQAEIGRNAKQKNVVDADKKRKSSRRSTG